jgi:type II secretory pathway pseudopilin PulG
MSIAPFSPRPATPESESRRARLVVVIAMLGIAATLLAYAISPGVRHAVGHAAHSVKHAVGHVFDHDHGAGSARKRSLRLVAPLRPSHSKPPGRAVPPKRAGPPGRSSAKQAIPGGVAAP